MISEWRHLYRRFRDFIAAVRLTPVEENLAAGAAVSVALSLRRQIHPEGGPVSDYLLIGSHGKGTAIRPAAVIDVVYELSFDLGRPTVLNDVANLLAGDFPNLEVAKGWVAVRTENAGIEVRVIPGFADPSGSGYLVPDPSTPTYAEPRWRRINPSAEREALHIADLASSEKASQLILMLKAWRRTRRVPIASLALELLVSEFVMAWTAHRRSILFYDWMIRDFFYWMRLQQGRLLQVPGTLEGLALGSDWLGHAEDAYLAALQACLMERDNRPDEAIVLWSQVFGRAFIDGAAAQPASTETLALPQTTDGKASSAA